MLLKKMMEDILLQNDVCAWIFRDMQGEEALSAFMNEGI
jgi:hypothetical protein